VDIPSGPHLSPGQDLLVFIEIRPANISSEATLSVWKTISEPSAILDSFAKIHLQRCLQLSLRRTIYAASSFCAPCIGF
jgi:hypothetical protein